MPNQNFSHMCALPDFSSGGSSITS